MNRDGKNIFLVSGSFLTLLVFSFVVLIFSPVYALVLLGGILIIFACWRYPLWALFLLIVWLPFEPFALKWVSDELYIAARYASEFLIYALAATSLITSVIQGRIFSKKKLMVALGALVIVAIASALINGNGIFDSLLGIRHIIRFPLLFVAVLFSDISRKHVSLIMTALISIAVIQSGIAFTQSASHGVLDGWLAPTERRSFESIQLTSGTDLFWEGGQRVFATMGRYDQLGLFLSFVLMMVMGLAYQRAIDRRHYWYTIFASIGMAVALLLTYSRASWFGFGIGAGLIAIALMRDKRVMGGLAIIFIFAVFSFLSYGVVREYLRDVPSQTIAERFFEAFSPERLYGEYYDHGRLYFMAQTPLKVVQHALLLGVGPGYYGGGAAAALHQTDGAEKLGLPFGIRGSEGYIDNNWFSLLGELGYVGFVVYAAIIFLLFRTGYRVFRYSDSALMRGVGLGYCGFVTALSFQAFLGTYFEVRTIAPYLWIIGGILAREEV